MVATPLSYWYINDWMEGFAYQVSISWWIYLMGGITSALVAGITVGVKVWKAANANPVDSLRYE